MKRIAWVCLGFVAFAGFANASFITVSLPCSPEPVFFPGGTGTVTVACPGFTSSSPINTVTLTDLANYDGGSASFTQISMSFTATGSWTPNPGVVTVSGFFAATLSNNPVIQNATAGLGGFSFSAFNVTITSSVLNGTVIETVEDPVVNYTYNVPVSTPEPTGEVLIGAALLGLAVVYRGLRS